MAKVGGTEATIGVGVEATAGTAVAASIYPKWTEVSLQGVVEKTMLKSARGIRNETSDSRIRRKYSKGSIGFIPNVKDIAPFLYSALGSLSSSSVADSAYTHTITVQDANASMKTLTAIIKKSSVLCERFANVVVNAFNLEVSDDYAKVTADLLGGFPDTTTLSPAYTQPTEFAYSDMVAKFGTSFSNAAGNSATPLKGFTLNINNNVQLDEAFLSGAVSPAVGAFVAGRLQITGTYTLQFADTTELDKYKAHTKNALIVTFTGQLIGSASAETLTLKLGKLVLTNPPIEYNVDGLIILKQEFTVENDPTDGSITAVVINAVASY